MRGIGHEHPESNHYLFQQRAIHGPLSAYTGEISINLCPFHQAAREGGVQGRQSERPVPESLDKLTAQAEQDYGTKLRVVLDPRISS